MRVLAIAGSLRSASSSFALVRAIAAIAPSGIQVDVYEGLGDLPMFSPDLDAEGAVPPPAVADLRAKLAAADAALLCTPEYAFGMPGVLKNAIDWLVSSGELNGKPVAALSASPSVDGGVRALRWLRETLSAIDARVPEEASFAVPKVRLVVTGGELADAATAEKVRAALTSLGRAAQKA